MTKDDSLYKRSYFSSIAQMEELVPDAFRSFVAFDRAALAPGRLSAKTKELIAIAVAHITGCPYCIEVHVEGGRQKGVTREEMAEAIVVATALKAGAALAHGVNALNAYEGDGDDELYRSSYFKRLSEFGIVAPDGFTAFAAFDRAALDEGVIGRRDKELIAVACAHATGCPYCIELHTKAAKREGSDAAEIAEAIMVATALKAGAALAHSVNALRV